jgi:hypothetical protein
MIVQKLTPIIPDYVDKLLAQIINECWKSDPLKRLTFAQLLSRLNKIRDESNNRITESVTTLVTNTLSTGLEPHDRVDYQSDPSSRFSADTE